MIMQPTQVVRMTRQKILVEIEATMRLPRDPRKQLSLDLAELKWQQCGSSGIGPVDPVLLDLLEVARVVYEFDRRQPKRTTGVRIKRVAVTMPVRAPKRWTVSAKAELRELLRIQGNADWVFDFVDRGSSRSDADVQFVDPQRSLKDSAAPMEMPLPPVQSVALFSGGLDSTSGLAALADQADRTLLVAYCAQNCSKQRRIAERLGFERLVQIRSDWKAPSSARRAGGQFMYRSFLFLSLASAFAHTVGARSLLQFENGPLALAWQPLDIYRITRHAHPLVHEHFSTLLKCLTRREISVSNPFLLKTKGEVVMLLKSHFNRKADFLQVVGETESCWYLNSTAVVAGPARKKNGEPCGACVPCLVRRAALGGDDTRAAADFRKSAGTLEKDPVARVHYEAYSGFVRRMLHSNYTQHDFLEELPTVTRTALLSGKVIEPEGAFALYRRFAQEWIRAFP